MPKRDKGFSNNKYNNSNNYEEPPAKKQHEDFMAPKPTRGEAPAAAVAAATTGAHVRPVTPEASTHGRPITPENRLAPSSSPSTVSISDNAAAKDDALKGVPITDFRVSDENIAQLEKRGITSLFPIQSGSFDYVYDGDDVVGRAQTGSGKTLSFVLPLVERIIANSQGPQSFRGWRKPKVICVAPTRELARQNAEEFERCTAHTNMKTVLVYGGTQIGAQCKDLSYGSDIIVGTPGRIIDLTERNALDLSAVECVIRKISYLFIILLFYTFYHFVFFIQLTKLMRCSASGLRRT